jgi:predicted O-methyltransferase YrrM
MTTVHAETCAKMGAISEFRAWRSGTMDQNDYAHWLERNASLPPQLGLNEDKFNLTLRYTSLEDALQECISRDLRSRMKLSDRDRNKIHDIRSLFDQSDCSTYIFPEEEEAIAAFVAMCNSRHVLVVGSYFGYWAAMAAAVVLAGGGSVTLVDPDARVMAIAKQNFQKLFPQRAVQFVCADFFHWFREAPLPEFDTVVIDADGDQEEPSYEKRGKRIYGPVVDAIFQRRNPTEVRLIVHNMITYNRFQNRYFTNKVRRYIDDYRTMFYVLERAGKYMYEIPTTEGIGLVL